MLLLYESLFETSEFRLLWVLVLFVTKKFVTDNATKGQTVVTTYTLAKGGFPYNLPFPLSVVTVLMSIY